MSKLRLSATISALSGPAFKAVLKREIEAAAALLPLQQALTTGSHALSEGASVMVITTDAAPGRVRARVGVFFSSVIAGCNCADDPSPIEAQSEYCELELEIDQVTAEASVTLSD